MDFSSLVGKTLVEIKGAEKDSDEIKLIDSEGQHYIMYHVQDCCESVLVEDVSGDIEDLLDSPILFAYESTNRGGNPDDYDSQTWTFYRIATQKGGVVIRWLGQSNGYYSESVTFEKGYIKSDW